ncbi:hypothetical protein KAW65_05025 [candidate division WOR-3 bacterium]|nr:hypothetical protein [candidate division WOR-3 bacterium]
MRIKKAFLGIGVILMLTGCERRELIREGKPSIGENLVVNGSFEEVRGDAVVGWENADIHNISHDVSEGGGNNSLRLVRACVIEPPATQRVVIPFSSSNYKMSCFVKMRMVKKIGTDY